MAKVRLIDIANELGVSSVTVHNALAGNKGVSENTRRKILETARRMGYHSDADHRKTLREEGGFHKIGVIIAENYLAQYSTFYWKMYQELSLIATEKRCYTTIEVLKKEVEKHIGNLPQIVQECSVEGLIIIGEIDKGYIRTVKGAFKGPVIFLDFYDNEIAKDAVISDNFYGMYQMTELLFEQGIEEIGFIGSVYATSSIMDRFCGYRKAIMEHRKTVPEEWILEDRDEMGQVAFELPKRLPEAFVCNCDLVAGMAIEKIRERGLRVPEDISVVGFDNYLYPGFADMKITTYEVNSRAMAKVAVDKLLKNLKNPEKGRTLEVVSGHVVWKKSVKMKGL